MQPSPSQSSHLLTRSHYTAICMTNEIAKGVICEYTTLYLATPKLVLEYDNLIFLSSPFETALSVLTYLLALSARSLSLSLSPSTIARCSRFRGEAPLHGSPWHWVRSTGDNKSHNFEIWCCFEIVVPNAP